MTADVTPIDLAPVAALLALIAAGDPEAAQLQVSAAVEQHPNGVGGFIYDLAGVALLGQQAVAAGLGADLSAADLAYFWQQWATASAAE